MYDVKGYMNKKHRINDTLNCGANMVWYKSRESLDTSSRTNGHATMWKCLVYLWITFIVIVNQSIVDQHYAMKK